MIRVVKNTQDNLVAVRAFAQSRNGVFRAPHHTVSAAGLMSELAIAGGGVLWIDSADEYRSGDIAALGNTWAMTHPVFRAAVFFAVEDLEREQARPDQPKVKVATRVLFEERIARFKALDAQTWPLSRLAGPTT